MAGLNFIWSKGAAGPGEATKEIDFVPYILFLQLLAGVWTAGHRAMLGQAGMQYSFMQFFTSE